MIENEILKLLIENWEIFGLSGGGVLFAWCFYCWCRWGGRKRNG